MDSDNQQVIYREDGEYRVYCNMCDKLCIERFYRNHIKSQSHTNIIRKRQQLKKSFQLISLIKIWNFYVKYVIEQLSKMKMNIINK